MDSYTAVIPAEQQQKHHLVTIYPPSSDEISGFSAHYEGAVVLFRNTDCIISEYVPLPDSARKTAPNRIFGNAACRGHAMPNSGTGPIRDWQKFK